MILRMIQSFILVITFCVSATVMAELPPNSNAKTQTNYVHMLKQAMPSVVNISVVGELPAVRAILRRSPRGPVEALPPLKPRFRAVGSGVVVDANKGYIVTNAHVIANAKSITVTLTDGRRFRAKKIGADKLSDIAILQIHADHLHALPLAKANELQVGDFVTAIGNAFGLHQTVTSGIVSALHRMIGVEGPRGYENFIQTDAPINPGNSGGALINIKGQLVGINTAILAPSGGNIGIGFAIPVSMVKRIMNELIKHGKIKRGIMGVMVQNMSPDLADALGMNGVRGAVVTQITPNSPAAKAGIKPEDVIEKMNGVPVATANQLRNATGLLPIGTAVHLTIRQRNKTKTINVKIGDPKKLMAISKRTIGPLSGMKLADVDELVAGKIHVKGAQVRGVLFDSNAWLAGIRAGDVITAANNQSITTIAELMKVVNHTNKQLLLKVRRGPGVIFLVVR